MTVYFESLDLYNEEDVGLEEKKDSFGKDDI